MELNLKWANPISLKALDGAGYAVDLNKLPKAFGVYVFARRFGSAIEALYVGQALDIQSRVKQQLNNLKLMKAIKYSKKKNSKKKNSSHIGKRVVITGQFIAGRAQQHKKCLLLIERSLIRYFLSEGNDLVNEQGTHLRRHEIKSVSHMPKSFIPTKIFLDA